jgi:hypothetical protein
MSLFSRNRAVEQPQGLIRVLLDESAEYGDRGDAAMDLGAYDEPEAEGVLLSVACRPGAHPDLAERRGESLGEIWSRRDALDADGLARLEGAAKEMALGVIEARRPEWREEVEALRPAS